MRWNNLWQISIWATCFFWSSEYASEKKGFFIQEPLTFIGQAGKWLFWKNSLLFALSALDSKKGIFLTILGKALPQGFHWSRSCTSSHLLCCHTFPLSFVCNRLCCIHIFSSYVSASNFFFIDSSTTLISANFMRHPGKRNRSHLLQALPKTMMCGRGDSYYLQLPSQSHQIYNDTQKKLKRVKQTPHSNIPIWDTCFLIRHYDAYM